MQSEMDEGFRNWCRKSKVCSPFFLFLTQSHASIDPWWEISNCDHTVTWNTASSLDWSLVLRSQALAGSLVLSSKLSSNTGYPQNPMIQWLIHMFVLEWAFCGYTMVYCYGYVPKAPFSDKPKSVFFDMLFLIFERTNGPREVWSAAYAKRSKTCDHCLHASSSTLDLHSLCL